VSTDENPISATRVSAETRAVQWIGQMAEATIQPLSRDQENSLQRLANHRVKGLRALRLMVQERHSLREQEHRRV
jgi:hypothetical protein